MSNPLYYPPGHPHRAYIGKVRLSRFAEKHDAEHVEIPRPPRRVIAWGRLIKLAIALALIAWAAFASCGCATIERKESESVQVFCSDWAVLRPSNHSLRYWYNDCLRREYARGPCRIGDSGNVYSSGNGACEVSGE